MKIIADNKGFQSLFDVRIKKMWKIPEGAGGEINKTNDLSSHCDLPFLSLNVFKIFIFKP